MPELSAGLPRIPGPPWKSLSHRQVLAELATEGWVPRGVGDWADHPVAGQFAEQWRTRAADPEFEEVCRAAQMIDAEYRKSTPWWGRCDLDDAHIFRAADQPVLIDVYRPGKQHRRDPCPQKGLGTRCRTADRS